VVISFLRSMGSLVLVVWSAFSACEGLMFWVVLRSEWNFLILLLGGGEAFWASSSCSRLRVLFRLGVLCCRLCCLPTLTHVKCSRWTHLLCLLLGCSLCLSYPLHLGVPPGPPFLFGRDPAMLMCLMNLRGGLLCLGIRRWVCMFPLRLCCFPVPRGLPRVQLR